MVFFRQVARVEVFTADYTLIDIKQAFRTNARSAVGTEVGKVSGGVGLKADRAVEF